MITMRENINIIFVYIIYREFSLQSYTLFLKFSDCQISATVTRNNPKIYVQSNYHKNQDAFSLYGRSSRGMQLCFYILQFFRYMYLINRLRKMQEVFFIIFEYLSLERKLVQRSVLLFY